MFQFQKSTPEGVGIPSGAILRYLDCVQKEGLELHSIALVRHQKICVEGYWAPYHSELCQLMYSSTKTVTALAAGLAVQEGILRMDESLEEIFAGEMMHDSMRKVTVEHLLTMSCGHETEINCYQPEWIQAFLNHPSLHEPGTFFFYNTAGVNMIVAMIRRRTGCNLLEYLRPRLLDPLGISRDIFCGTLPDGTEIGGGGLFWRTEDYLRFTQFLLQQGSWEGRQLLDAAWLRKATSPRISADEVSDYGYFTWMDHGRREFSSRGMMGQFGICSEDKDAIFVVTAQASTVREAPNYADRIRVLAEEILFPSMGEEPLPETEETRRLADRLSHLTLPALPTGYSPMARKVDRQSFAPVNPMTLGALFEYFFMDGAPEFRDPLKKIELSFDPKQLTLKFHLQTAETCIQAGMDGGFRVGRCFGETYAACGRWRSAGTLELEIRLLERIMGSRILMKFREDGLILEEDSMDLNNYRAEANLSASRVFRKAE